VASPALARYFERLGSFARVIVYDNRGSGVSDPIAISNIPSLDRWNDDIQAVLAAVGAEQSDLVGETEGGAFATMFAATYPERVRSLILVNSFARWRRADDYPVGMPDEVTERMLDVL
jgi:pimeloyl-ACP methyl ester carboxylesterase